MAPVRLNTCRVTRFFLSEGDQQRRALNHAPRSAARTKPTLLAADGNQFLGVTILATHPQEPILQQPALQVILELSVHESRQGSAAAGQVFDKDRIILFDDLIEQGLLGAMAHVRCAARPRRVVGVLAWKQRVRARPREAN